MDSLWFRGKTVAKILGYTDTDKSLRKHVDSDDKIKFGDFLKPAEMVGLKKNEKNTICINESYRFSC